MIETALMIITLILGYTIGIVGGICLSFWVLAPDIEEEIIYHLPADQGALGGEVKKTDTDLAITPLPEMIEQDNYTPAYLRAEKEKNE